MKSIDILTKAKSYVSRKSNSNIEKKKIEFSLKSKNISNKAKNQKERTNKIKLTKAYYKIINFFIIILISIIRVHKQLLLLNDCYITFKIKPNSSIKLFNINYQDITLPSIIEINGANYTNISFNHIIISNSEEEQVVKLIWENGNEPKSTNYLFQGCSNITEIDLSNFNTSNIELTGSLFSDCKALISLDISNFNTSKVINMDYMFSNCQSLVSLNLSNFDTSKVNSMSHIFNHCINLIILDISNFNTAQVSIMSVMFGYCYSLTSLDLSNFNTSKVELMGSMFLDCHSINSLNLINFDTSNVKKMDFMFANCLNLISLNLSNFNTDKVNTTFKMFYNCPNLLYINLNIAKIKNSTDTREIFNNTNNNLTICSKNEEWSYLLSNEHLIINCINTKNNKTSFKCYQKLSNNINNNNICEFCGLNYIREINDLINIINCYNICPYYHFFDIYSKEMFCLESCSGLYNKLIKEKNECIDDGKRDDIYKYKYENQYNIICINKTILVIEHIYQLINEINKTKLENGNDEEIKEENIIITLTTTLNQKNNENINKTTINLGECESKLKWYYNISINDSLYMIKLDKKEEGMKIPKIEYEVYYPLNSSNNLTKLNLSICRNNKIEISIPVIIKESLDKYNISSKYYNDICITATSKHSADITLLDRKNEFINNNMTLCEENCKLIEYNYTSKRAKCSCDIKTNIPNIDKIKFDKDLLKKSFIDINNMMNLNVMKCYKKVFIKNKLKNNLGFIINFLVIFLFIISFFIFVCKSFDELYKDIKKIILAKKNIQ